MTTDEAIQRKFNFRRGNRNLPWYPNRLCSRNDLVDLFGALGFTNGVEVGTYKGHFALEICLAIPTLHLTCIDPWIAYGTGIMHRSQKWEDRYYKLAERRVRGKNVTIVRKTSMEGVLEFADRSVDFVWIDGNHDFDFAMLDLIHWTAKVKPGGIVAVHDYDVWEGSDVTRAVNAYTNAHRINPWYVTQELTPTAYWVQK